MTAVGKSAEIKLHLHLADGTDNDANFEDLRGRTAEVARRQPDGSGKCLFDHSFGAGHP